MVLTFLPCHATVYQTFQKPTFQIACLKHLFYSQMSLFTELKLLDCAMTSAVLLF